MAPARHRDQILPLAQGQWPALGMAICRVRRGEKRRSEYQSQRARYERQFAVISLPRLYVVLFLPAQRKRQETS